MKALGGRGGWEGAGGLGSPAKYKSKLLGVLPGWSDGGSVVVSEGRAELSSTVSMWWQDEKPHRSQFRKEPIHPTVPEAAVRPVAWEPRGLVA